MKESFYDRDGKLSVKRVFGGILVLIGILMGIGLFSIGLTDKVLSSNISERMVYLFLSVGGGLMGISVLEHLKPSEKKIQYDIRKTLPPAEDDYLGHNQQENK